MSCLIYIKYLNNLKIYDWGSRTSDEPGIIQLIFWGAKAPYQAYEACIPSERTKLYSISELNANCMGKELYSNFLQEPQAAGLIDIDSHEITLFEDKNGETYLPYRRIYISLMQKNWPTWKIRWTTEGFGEILDRIGIKDHGFRFNVFSKEYRSLAFTSKVQTWSMVVEYFLPLDLQSQEPGIIGELLDGIEDFCSTQPNFLITLKSSNQVQDYGFNLVEGDLFTIGPAIIPKLKQVKPIGPIIERCYLSSGILIDLDLQKMTFWLDHHVEPEFMTAVSEIWKRWEVSSHNKGLPYQYAQTGRHPEAAMMPFREAAERVRGWLASYSFDPEQPRGMPNLTRLDEMLSNLEPHYSGLWKFAGETAE